MTLKKTIYSLDNKLLEILLKDHSSNKNIIWATDNYKSRGSGYYEFDHMTLKAITGRNGLVRDKYMPGSQIDIFKKFLIFNTKM